MAGSIHDRAARILGWSKSATQSMSLQSLRDLVRSADPELAKDITKHIHSGGVVRGATAANMDWLGPPPTAEQSAAYEKKRLVAVDQYLKWLDRVTKNESYLNMARERAARLADIFRNPPPVEGSKQ